MAEPAIRRMTLDEFLRWEDGTDTRYELIEGCPTAMAPPARAHGMLCARLAAVIHLALRTQRACSVHSEAGIARPDRNDTCYIADLAVTCRPYRRGEQLIEDPILVVEVMSPGTNRHDRQTKVPAYRQLESVQEILLVDLEATYAEVFRRNGAVWLSEIIRGRQAELQLTSIDLQLPLVELYEGIDLETDATN